MILPISKNFYIRQKKEKPIIIQMIRGVDRLKIKHANNEGVTQALDLLEQAVKESEKTKSQIDLSDLNLKSLFVHLEGKNKKRANLEDLILMFSNLKASCYSLYKANLDGVMLDLANLEEANLEKASLKRAKLFGVFLNNANLKKADLSEANLIEADLIGANLKKAKLYKTNLVWADLSNANLKKANLVGARLERTNFSCANLKMVDLTDANLSNANFKGADLREAFIYKHGRQIIGQKLKSLLIEEFNVQVDKDTKS